MQTVAATGGGDAVAARLRSIGVHLVDRLDTSFHGGIPMLSETPARCPVSSAAQPVLTVASAPLQAGELSDSELEVVVGGLARTIMVPTPPGSRRIS